MADEITFNPKVSGSSTTYDVTVQASIGGTTLPAPGVYSVAMGQQFSVTATPITNYYFSHWTQNGVNIGSANPISITVNSNMTLSAVFTTTPPSYLWIILGVVGVGAAGIVAYLLKRKKPQNKS